MRVDKIIAKNNIDYLPMLNKDLDRECFFSNDAKPHNSNDGDTLYLLCNTLSAGSTAQRPSLSTYCSIEQVQLDALENAAALVLLSSSDFSGSVRLIEDLPN
ncbi:unnamed protein product [Lupinus luteus]|uniref:Uncharacterized protein n=1 Tax=Lupinus luteus TaxID=3873 RepID=A0AAV1W6M5_LUPLU